VFLNTCTQDYKFNGKERDPDMGVYDFGARFFQDGIARFYSPDWSATVEPVPYAKLNNPQSLNLYTYVLDNPLSFRDADGHELGADTLQEVQKITSDSGNAAQNNKTVPVTVDKVKAANPLGHSTIKVDGGQRVGLVPNSDKEAAKAAAKEIGHAVIHDPKDSPVPGHIEPLAPDRVIRGEVVLYVTPEQAKNMQTTINEDTKNLHVYDAGYGNCAEWVEHVLRSGGVDAPFDVTPGGLVNDLKQNSAPQ
jgi:RHS repeat-associated protein